MFVNNLSCCSKISHSAYRNILVRNQIINLNKLTSLHSNLFVTTKNVFSTFTSNSKVLQVPQTNENKSNLFKYRKYINLNSFFTSSSIYNHKHVDKDLEIIKLRFPNPKTVLNNYYMMAESELKTPSLLNSQYKVIPNKKYFEWTCTYSIKWPEEAKVTATAYSKADASKKAAMKVLALLDKAGKISNKGLPLIYDQKAFNQITKRTYVPVVLDKVVENNLIKICDIYENHLKDKLEINLKKNNESRTLYDTVEDNIINAWSLQKQKYKDIDSYYAKELVELPIRKHKEEFEKLLDNNRIIIVRGEPGCGKSTRVPQYLLEHWVKNEGTQPVRIICTQPRRLAAISLAERVANERQERVGDVIGYQVRLKTRFNPQSGRILYCTTGILLRQLQSDATLQNCTHVIIDEAHERDVFTDLLMNLLRHALNLNPKLKVVVMSATMDAALFKNYFNNAPVLKVAGFTYPVKMHFLDDIPINLRNTENMNDNTTPMVIYDDVAKVIRWIHKTKPEGAILCFLPGWDEISRVKYSLENILDRHSTCILTLHSKLSDEDQRKIFGHPPKGVRKIVLGTNIAETSVTIDDVVYVVDTGIHKETRYDAEKGITCLGNHWISKSSTNQRKGRAGRVQPGESFHLFSREKYKTLPEFSIPEILRISLDKIVLDAKVYSNNMNAVDFFSNLPCPPDDSTVLKAVDELTDLELLDENENVTPLGKVLSEFQLTPKLSKAMVQSVIYKCVTPIVDIATIFSSDTVMFSSALVDKPAIKSIKEKMSPTSDHIAMMLLFEQWQNFILDENYEEADNFCVRNNLVRHRLGTLKKLEEIHFEYLEKYLKNAMELSDKYSENDEIVKGVLLSGVGNVLMNRKWDIVKGRLKSVHTYITKKNHKATITPESVNCKKTNYKSPFLVYINETKSLLRNTMLVRETSLINPLTLILFKNGHIYYKICNDEDHETIKNGVILGFQGTKLKFLLTERQAQLILMCKEAVKNIETYLIHQLTEGGEENKDVLDQWDKILDIISETLRSEDSET